MPKAKREPSTSELLSGIGRRMQWAREASTPNRAEAARLLGVDTSTLTKIESGDRAPNVFLVIAFCNRYRVSTDYVMRGILTDADHPALAARLAAEHPELGRMQMPRNPLPNTGTDRA